MTSNIGTRDLKVGGGLGFTHEATRDDYKDMKSTINTELKRVFNPEFLNRIDDTIVFHRLKKENIMQIINIQVKDLVKRMSRLNLTIDLSHEALEFLANEGFSEEFGARPLKRVIQRFVEDPLAEEILNNRFGDGSKIQVLFNKEKEELKQEVREKKSERKLR